MATDSFTGTANGISAATAIMANTDSLTGTANGVSSAVVTLAHPSSGNSALTKRGWQIVVNAKGVGISKATSFGGTQQAFAGPYTLEDVRDLVPELLKAIT